MKYVYFLLRRCFWTVICKFSANTAAKFPKTTCLVGILDSSLNKLSVALSDEATFCMMMTAEWQDRAKKCVLAHHENEKILKPKGSF